MRKVGWINGSSKAVTAALRDVLGSDGTLVVPAMTTGNSDTSDVYLERTAGMTDEEIERYRAAMPPFVPDRTPSTGMGRVAEEVRRAQGAIRSDHPQSSFAAIGPLAHQLMDGHRRSCHLGEESPLARLYDADAKVLLLGVGYEVFTAFHLAEYRYKEDPPTRLYRCVISIDGHSKWWEYRDVVLDDSDFVELGLHFEQVGELTRGVVGHADSRVISLRSSVDFAAAWLRENRR